MTADDVRDLERRAAEQQALKGLRAGTANRESIENTLSKFAQDEQQPVRRRFITNDPTVEKLVELLKENPAGILLHRDELRAWLASFEREGREGDRNFYLEAWAGDDSHTDDRIGRGTIDCDAACVSVLGGLTPGPFLSYLRTAAFSGRGDDGLLQRFQVLVWPDVNGEWRDIDRWPDTAARRITVDAFRRLADLDVVSIGAETDRFEESIPFLRFDPVAQDEFLEWRAGLEHEVRSGKHHEAWDSYLAKHRSLVPSIALIDHLANGGIGPVGLPSLTRALAWLEYLKSHAARVYDGLLRRDQSAARALGTKILAGALRARFSLRDVYNQAWSGLSDRAAVVAAVDVLCDLCWLCAERRETLGRTAVEYAINPKLMARDGNEQA